MEIFDVLWKILRHFMKKFHTFYRKILKHLMYEKCEEILWKILWKIKNFM